MSVTRAQVVEAARAWDGRRWRHKGRNEYGVDCVGLPRVIARQFGLSDYDFLDYGREPDAAKFLQHFAASGCVRIDIKAARDADLIIFHQSGYPCHVGIMATRRGVRTVIHSSASHKKVVEEDLRPDATVVAAYRMPGIIG